MIVVRFFLFLRRYLSNFESINIRVIGFMWFEVDLGIYSNKVYRN